MSYAALKLIESGQTTVADSIGFFEIQDVCPGEYHVLISHVGFEMERFFVSIQSDTHQTFTLHHHEEFLNEVVIHGEKTAKTTEVSHSLDYDHIKEAGNKNLADLVGGIAGVSTIKNGSGISKPIIHGLYGNRVVVLNNGVVQSGQQWGVDHAPEIDPFVADHISVVKGVAGLQLIGGSLGGALLIEPGTITKDPHIHGSANYIFQTNGLGHTLNAQIEKSGSLAEWRLTGTVKKFGDSHAPDYFLTNTGKTEQNIALQIEKALSENWRLNGYYSFFNTEIGILKASHVGDSIALQEALEREVPQSISDHFSYNINPPRQEVDHHLFKLESRHSLDKNQMLSFSYAGQLNLRDEFDPRRGGRSDRPMLSMSLWSNYFDAKYVHDYQNDLELSIGLQNQYSRNRNDNALTGANPLIPDYNANNLGGFMTVKKHADTWDYELGGRFDLKYLHVKNITDEETIEHLYHNFFNYSLAGGVSRKLGEQITANFNLGFAQRAPEVNELYSDGLHQGVASIERGDPNLNIERSLKAILSANFHLIKGLFFEAIGYVQNFDNYIFLRPDGTEISNRGTFFSFSYDQTDARILGADFMLNYEPVETIKLNVAYALIKGDDLTNDLPLVYMPPNNLTTELTTSFRSMGFLKNNSLSFTGSYTARQKNYEEGQDFLPPPADYFLLGLRYNTQVDFKKSNLKISVSAENLLNQSYRDYLNRLRYFADETGRNFTVSLNYEF